MFYELVNFHQALNSADVAISLNLDYGTFVVSRVGMLLTTTRFHYRTPGLNRVCLFLLSLSSFFRLIRLLIFIYLSQHFLNEIQTVNSNFVICQQLRLRCFYYSSFQEVSVLIQACLEVKVTQIQYQSAPFPLSWPICAFMSVVNL